MGNKAHLCRRLCSGGKTGRPANYRVAGDKSEVCIKGGGRLLTDCVSRGPLDEASGLSVVQDRAGAKDLELGGATLAQCDRAERGLRERADRESPWVSGEASSILSGG